MGYPGNGWKLIPPGQYSLERRGKDRSGTSKTFAITDFSPWGKDASGQKHCSEKKVICYTILWAPFCALFVCSEWERLGIDPTNKQPWLRSCSNLEDLCFLGS